MLKTLNEACCHYCQKSFENKDLEITWEDAVKAFVKVCPFCMDEFNNEYAE